MYGKINELSPTWVNPDHSGSQSNGELKESNGKPAEKRKNNIQCRAEMNCIEGSKQLHFKVPPFSLQVDAKVYAVGGGFPTGSY